MDKRYLEANSIGKILEKYPFLIEFLNENDIVITGKEHLTFIEFYNTFTLDQLEDKAINVELILQNISEYLKQMIALLGLEEKDEVNSLTILPGRNKLGDAENFGELTIKKGDIVSIVGPTGSGKSRLLADIEWTAQGDTPTLRKILINEETPDKKWRYSSSNKLVAQLSQNMNFVMDLSVYDFLELHAKSRMVENEVEVINKIIEEANNLAGESFKPETPITSLSGGQSRALMIADTAILSSSPIILIDEYDQALITAHTYGYFKEAMNFYRNFLSTVLKDNEYLERAILTGILRVAKESIFSGLNNLKVDSILKNQFNYFGLSEEEVLEALKYYKRDYEIQEVKEWYNGYSFGKNLVYNPWSILNFIKYDNLKPYWVNTSTNDLIKDGLSNLSKSNYDNFVKLTNGENIDIELEENISFDTLERESTIWNLMMFSGYLSLTENQQVRFVNKEVRNFYISSFKELAGNDIGEFNKLLKFLLNKDIKKFFKITIFACGLRPGVPCVSNSLEDEDIDSQRPEPQFAGAARYRGLRHPDFRNLFRGARSTLSGRRIRLFPV